jgi:hypothetical protein
MYRFTTRVSFCSDRERISVEKTGPGDEPAAPPSRMLRYRFAKRKFTGHPDDAGADSC